MRRQQQAVLPLLAHTEFGVGGHCLDITLLAALGIAKAAANSFAGTDPRALLDSAYRLSMPIPTA
ncbi:hypothetical protein ACT3R5_16190 [Glutamicibacter sp. AOP5-A2-7]